MSSTINYGAITEIVDNRTSYSMRDSTGTDYTFEVYPLIIDQSQINQAITSLDIPNFWFIDYQVTIGKPSDTDIQKALNEGLLLKLSMNCFVIDNYGITHNVEFLKDTGEYILKIHNIIKIIRKNENVMALSDLLIDFIKESDNKRLALSSIDPGRQLFAKLFDKIKDLENRIKVLEQK